MKSSTLPLLWAPPSCMFPLQGTKPGIFLLLQGKRCTLEPRILKQCHSADIFKWRQFSQPFFFQYSFSGWKSLCGWKSVCGVACCHLVALQGECAVVFFFQKVAWKVLKDIHHLTFIRDVTLNRRLRTKERSLLWLRHSYCQIKNDLRILASSDSVFRLHTKVFCGPLSTRLFCLFVTMWDHSRPHQRVSLEEFWKLSIPRTHPEPGHPAAPAKGCTIPFHSVRVFWGASICRANNLQVKSLA